MGIRYDRDTRRATNGPLIFFSDPSSQEGFAEEISGSIISGLSFYAYREPSSSMINFGSSEGCVEGIGIPGFVAAFFNPALPYITIPYKGAPKQSPGSMYTPPAISTSYDEYKNEVETLISRLDVRGGGKVVAARVIVREDPPDLAEMFYSLCSRYSQAFVFAFSTPATGCWIGASPELLLKATPEGIETMALAGTRAAGSVDEWDSKNIEEQVIVTDYILKVLENNGLRPVCGETFTKGAGNIEHICTPVYADRVEDTAALERLLRELSPTPALCGYPKDFALKEIADLEKFDRGCYGGFCGPFHSVDNFSFNVGVRCGSVTGRSFNVYVGGGITRKSEPEAEWRETEMKVVRGAR